MSTGATLETAPEQVQEHSPSVKLTYLFLREGGPATQKQIRKQTALSERTVRYAVEDLEELGVVETVPNFNDLRQKRYTVVE